MCLKELRPDFPIVGLTSQRNLEMVKGFPYFDQVYTYDDITSMNGAQPSLYFDALGNESITIACFEHLTNLKRWWAYGQGGEESLDKLLKINPRGLLYTNVIDALHYANSNGISDGDILTRSELLNQKYGLEQRWGEGYREIRTPRELYELYVSFLENTHPSGARVRYVSPLLPRE